MNDRWEIEEDSINMLKIITYKIISVHRIDKWLEF